MPSNYQGSVLNEIYLNLPVLALQPEPEAEEPAPEEPEPEEQTDGAGDDEDADAYGGYREDEGQGGDEGEEGEEGDDFEDDGMPDSPTNAYRPGGLGVGSHFFNADDLKCAPTPSCLLLQVCYMHWDKKFVCCAFCLHHTVLRVTNPPRGRQSPPLQSRPPRPLLHFMIST